MTENNVTPITNKQPASAAKFIISCQIDGFNVQVEVEGKADILRGMIDRLKAIGAQPPAIKSPTGDLKDDDAPVCEFHGKMRQGNRGGYFCPKKMGNGEYCKSKA
jgi:hypothetical protein